MDGDYQVIIVGCGIAGLAAADILTRYRVKVLIIDENHHWGGQLLRKYDSRRRRVQRSMQRGVLRNFRESLQGFQEHLDDLDGTKRKGADLVGRLRRRGVPMLHGGRVLGVFPGRELLAADDEDLIVALRSEFLLLAPGARERFVPFQGWTLPGVMSTGAAQILIKGSGVLPARRMVIGGTSPLMLLLAAEMTAAGGRVTAFLDQTSSAEKIRILNLGPTIWPRLLQGAVCLAGLLAARTIVKSSVRILAAEGDRRLESVVAARTDPDGKMIPKTERVYPTAALAVGWGFAPNIELGRQAGCRILHDPDRGGWFVSVDDAMTTSIDHLYAAGEITGIAGGAKSLAEGKIAAWSILHRLGVIEERTRRRKADPLVAGRQREIRYGRFFNALCRAPAACYTDIPDDTVICRCEGVTMGILHRQAAAGMITMNAVKRATRAGMGNCQGRLCGPIISDILGALTGGSQETVGYSAARAPVRMVPLGAIAVMTPDSDHRSKDLEILA